MARSKIIAHRGASAYAPENTMAAFELARQMGSGGIELDVQLTKDGKLVVIHDSTIDRTSNGSGIVERMTLEELRQYDYSYCFKEKFMEEGSRIPELREVIYYAKEHQLFLNVEIKASSNAYSEAYSRTALLINEYSYVENTIVSSFNHTAMVLLKQEFPEIRTAIVFGENIYRLDEYARKCRVDALHPYCGLVDKSFMKLATDNGLEVNTWTVDDEIEFKRLHTLGATRIMTNRPDIGRKE